MRFRTAAGVQRRLSLGTFPEISLASARTKAAKALTSVAEGGDPVTEKKQERAEAQTARQETVEGLGERYFAEAAKGRHRRNSRPKRPSTLALERSYFDRIIVPQMGKRPVAEISRSELQELINRVEDHESPSAAVQCRNVLRQLFTFARWLEVTNANPCAFLQVPAFKARERVLTDDELRTIWNACKVPVELDGAAVSAGTAIAIKLAAVTVQRRSEIALMHTSEIDRGARTWTIPGKRTKNHRTHIVPLSDLALELIDKAVALNRTADGKPYDGYVFPSPRDASKPITPAAITRAFRRIREALKLSDLRPHDFRRTGATALTSERLGVPRFIVSQVLNHASDSGDSAVGTATYDRNSYLAEKRRALERWADRLTSAGACLRRLFGCVDGTQEPRPVPVGRRVTFEPPPAELQVLGDGGSKPMPFLNLKPRIAVVRIAVMMSN
jgi:integrase